MKPLDYYMRRRDKVLVQINRVTGQEVEYHTVRRETVHKVSIIGFRKGFRVPTEEEIARANTTASGSPVGDVAAAKASAPGE